MSRATALPCVLRRGRLGERGELAHVQEQHGDLDLLALAGQDLEEGALAGPVAADDADNLAAADLEGHVLERPELGVPVAAVGHLDGPHGGAVEDARVVLGGVGSAPETSLCASQRVDERDGEQPVGRHQDDGPEERGDLEVVLEVQGIAAQALVPAQVLTDAGVNLEQSRAETLRLLGSDMPQASAGGTASRRQM